MGHNGGFNPFRDRNGEFTTPELSGKPGRNRKQGGGAPAVVVAAKAVPKTRGRPAERSAPCGAKMRSSASSAPLAAPARAPQLPKKWDSPTHLSDTVDKLRHNYEEARRDSERASSRSRFNSSEAQLAAERAARAKADVINNELAEAQRDLNTYRDEMARYRSRQPYRDS